ncbi:hypothetical protein BH10PSE7_BH10PSE7_37380 [soil metagenome]
MRHHLFQIRPYHARDLQPAAEAANAACRQAYAFFGYDYPVSTTRERLEEARVERQSMWVPEVDGQVVGILTLAPHFIDKLFLAPAWHGRGIGTALIHFAKTLHPDWLELHCAQENRPACRLYERHGFVALEHRIYQPIGIGDVVYRWTR